MINLVIILGVVVVAVLVAVACIIFSGNLDRREEKGATAENVIES